MSRFLVASLVGLTVAMPASAGPIIFINELHYDNTGADTGEAIEVAGPAGTNLSGWSLVLYNGANGLSYDIINLTGSIPNLSNAMGVLSFSTLGLQNGSPDGVALVNGATVVQFLSYEGSFIAANGPASGLTSVDIGVSEPDTTPVGRSLQLSGVGREYDQFTWTTTQANSFGAVNTNQTFLAAAATVPEPATFVLAAMMLAVAGAHTMGRIRRSSATRSR